MVYEVLVIWDESQLKPQKCQLEPELFAQKVEALRKKVLFNYEIESRLFTMDDMYSQK